MNESLTKELEDSLSECGLSQNERVKKRASVDRRMALWRSSRKRISLRTILDEAGAPAPSLQVASQLLFDHWSKVFDAKEVDQQAIARIIDYTTPWSTSHHPPPLFRGFPEHRKVQ